MYLYGVYFHLKANLIKLSPTSVIGNPARLDIWSITFEQPHLTTTTAINIHSTTTVSKMTANGHSEADQKVKMTIPKPPVFEDKHAEREYLKGRLAAAFRIFGKNGFDEGMPSIHL